MTTTAEQRYSGPASGSGTGHDLLLDVPVGVTRLTADRPEQLARRLRGTSPTPWWRVLDAVVDAGTVVVITPAPGSVLGDHLRRGVPAHTATALVAGLQPTLEGLQALGLRPQTLDPDRVWATADGQLLLLPVSGPGPGADEVAALLGALGSGPAEPLGSGPAEPLAAVPDAPMTAPLRLAVRDPEPETTRLPRPSLRTDGTSHRPWPGRRGRTIAVAGVAAVAALGAGVLALAPNDEPAASVATSRSGAAAVDPLRAATRALEQSPVDAGPAGPDLVQRLRGIEGSSGVERSFAAAGLVETVRTGRARGTLQGPLVDAVEQAATPLARPPDLAALIDVVEVEPSAFGPRTPEFLGRLQTLKTGLTGEAARAEAQDLWQIVQAGPAEGEFTPTFAALAAPVLRDLAVPADLAALVAAARVEPARFGPRTPKFLGRLQKLTTLQGQARTVEARDLLQIVQAGVGKRQFTPSFRDIAVPVLQPLTAA